MGNYEDYDMDRNTLRELLIRAAHDAVAAERRGGYKGAAWVADALMPAATAAQPGGEPVAYLWRNTLDGSTRVVRPDSVITADATWEVVGPLVLAAQRGGNG
jgi:hypothetical protein